MVREAGAMRLRVAVVGAGLGGLLAAVALERRGHHVTVFESAGAVGGVARTIIDAGYLIEPAASSFPLPHPALSPILHAAGVEVARVPSAVRRLVWDGRRLHDVPTTPMAVVRSGLAGPAGKLRALAELGVRSTSPPGETLAAFMVRRFGHEAGSLAAHLAATGVFAGDPHRLEAQAFPQLTALESASGSVLRGALQRRRSRTGPAPRLHVPVAGMAGLARCLAETVDVVRLGTTVSRVGADDGGVVVVSAGEESRWDRVVLAVDPSRMAALAGLEAATTATTDVAVVALGGRAEDMLLPDGFGLLATPGWRSPVLGVLNESGPGRAPPGHRLARVLAGGSRRPDIAGWDDDRLAAVVIEDVGRIAGTPVEPQLVRVLRRRIPQYVVGHAERVARTVAALGPRIVPAGWWHHGIGVTSLATEAVSIAGSLGEER